MCLVAVGPEEMDCTEAGIRGRRLKHTAACMTCDNSSLRMPCMTTALEPTQKGMECAVGRSRYAAWNAVEDGRLVDKDLDLAQALHRAKCCNHVRGTWTDLDGRSCLADH